MLIVMIELCARIVDDVVSFSEHVGLWGVGLASFMLILLIHERYGSAAIPIRSLVTILLTQVTAFSSLVAVYQSALSNYIELALRERPAFRRAAQLEVHECSSANGRLLI